MKKRLLMVLLVVALLVTVAVFTVQADETEHTYLDLATYNCPCSKCGGKPYTGTWITSYTHSMADGGHYYYKDQTLNPSSNWAVNSGEIVVILDNSTLNFTNSGRSLLMQVGTLHLIGNGGTFQGKGMSSTTANGGIAQIYSGGKLHLYGDLTVQKAADSTNTVKNGGLFRLTGSSSAITVHGGTLKGCAVSSTGGVAYVESGTFTLDGGTIEGSSDNISQAGAIRIAGGTVEVKSGTIKNGHATKGGNIYISAGKLNLSGGTITGGYSVIEGSTNGQGGNIFQSGGTINMTGGSITDGKAEVGGNIDTYNGTFKITGTGTATISGGESTGNAGNIYCYKGSDANNNYESNITVDNPNATISGGIAAGDGGNIYLIGNLTLKQGTISGGTADNGAGIRSTGTFTMEGGNLTGGTAELGGAVYMAGGTVTLQGGTVTGGTAVAGGAVYLYNGTLTVSGATVNGSSADKNVTSGGAIMAYQGTFNMTGGTIQNGYAVNGGNIYLQGVSLTVTDGTIQGGNASEMGGNVVMFYRSKNGDIAAASPYLYANGGTIKDGVVTLAEGTEDANTYGGGNVYISRACYLVVNGGTLSGGTASGGACGGNIFSRGKTTLTTGNITGGTAPDGATIYAYCQSQESSEAIHANYARVVVNGGTLTGGTAANYGGSIYIGAYGSADITGGTVTSGTALRGGNIYLSANSTLKIEGESTKITSGVATGKGGEGHGGGNICQAGGTITMSGGTIENGIANNDTNKPQGGNIRQNSGIFTMTGGTIQNGATSNLGGNARIAGTFNIQSGTVYGGTSASSGGSLALVGGALNISGGTVSGGDGKQTTKNGANGGLIYINTGTVTVSGNAILENGYATNGGLIQQAGGTLNITGGILRNGKASNYGGNIYANTLNVTGGTISGGTAKTGGNMYIKGGTISGATLSGGNATGGHGGTLYVEGNTVDMTGCTVTGGVVDGYQGGVAFVTGGATLTVTNSEITVNNDCENCKGFRVQGANLVLTGTTTIKYEGKRIGDAVDVVKAGTAAATVTLADSVSCVNTGTGESAAIHIQNYSKNHAKLIVKDNWTGTATFAMEYYGSGSYAEDTITYGETINAELAEVVDASDDGIGAFTGKLTFATISTDPQVFGEGASLVLPKTAIWTEDAKTWYKDNAAAVTAYAEITEPAYIRLYTDEALALGDLDEVYVNLNGHTVAATGTGIVNLLDTTVDTSAPSKGTLTGMGVATEVDNPLSGYKYINTGDSVEGYKTHALEIAVTGVSVRPASAGIYYKATIKCDDTLKGMLDQYGVAVSVAHMPNDQFNISGSQALYTSIPVADFVSGKAFTGVIINNIMKEGEATNDARAEMPIYANAYATFEIDGAPVTIMADEDNQGLTVDEAGFTGVAKNLKEVTKAVDTRYPTLSDAQKEAIAQMTTKFAADMADWDLLYMGSTDGKAARELKVLTIGNSLSVDAGRMLAYVASQEGIEITVGTLYYSGCSQAQHVKFLTNNEDVYTYYSSHWCDNPNCQDIDLTYGYEKWGGYTMEMGIKEEAWDVILTQQGVWSSATLSNYNSDMTTLRNYVTGIMTDPANPNANPYFAFGWNMNWIAPVEAELLNTCMDINPSTGKPKAPTIISDYKKLAGVAEDATLTEADQLKVYGMVVDCMEQKVVGSGMYPYFIASGTLMQNANTSYLSETELYRDYIHASDKMRLATAYLWLCELTGKDLTELCGEEGIVTTVPGVHRQAEANQGTDLVLTAEEKAIFEEAITNAIQNPLKVTQSAYTTAPEA